MQIASSASKPNVTIEVLGITEYIEGLTDGVELFHFPSFFNIIRYVILPMIANLHIMAIAAKIIPIYAGRLIRMMIKMPLFILLIPVSTVFPPARLIMDLL